MQNSTRHAREAADAISREWPQHASIGLILGTGAAAVAEAFRPQCKIHFDDLPHVAPATAVGHAGRFVGGGLDGRPIAILQGRVHLYEGYRPRQVEFPVHMLAALGVRTLIVTNASGGLNPILHCGDLVVIDDLLDLTFSPGVRLAAKDRPYGRAGYRGNPFSEELALLARDAAHRAQLRVHRGAYAGVLGPNYETRAEYRLLRRIADVVGMSTVHEVAAARRLGMRVLGLSVVTNECCPDKLSKTTGESVVRAVEKAADRLARLLVETCRKL